MDKLDIADPIDSPPDLTAAFEAFLSANEVESTEMAYANLLAAAACSALRGKGLELYSSLKAVLSPKLNFRLGKIFSTLDARVASEQLLRATMGVTPEAPFTILVCGAGPVGLRAAVEAAMLGMEVIVVEKRTSFSRANIITFWDETMADMLGLGAKVFRPNLCS